MNLTLRRYSNFYTYNLVCPVLVLSLVNVCAVLLPAELKLELVVTVLLGVLLHLDLELNACRNGPLDETTVFALTHCRRLHDAPDDRRGARAAL